MQGAEGVRSDNETKNASFYEKVWDYAVIKAIASQKALSNARNASVATADHEPYFLFHFR